MLECYLAACLIVGVPRVIDGDSIEVAGQRIRIWGVDAPEMNTDAGKDAARFLALALRGRDVSCVDTGGRTWGRIVARLRGRWARRYRDDAGLCRSRAGLAPIFEGRLQDVPPMKNPPGLSEAGAKRSAWISGI